MLLTNGCKVCDVTYNYLVSNITTSNQTRTKDIMPFDLLLNIDMLYELQNKQESIISSLICRNSMAITSQRDVTYKLK